MQRMTKSLAAIAGLILWSHLAVSGQEPAPSTLQTAKKVMILMSTEFASRGALERELLKRPEFKQWGMIITDNREEAELILQVDRKVFTTKFFLRIIDARNTHVLAADRANSIGGTIEPKLADRFIKQVKAVRPIP